MEEQQQQQQQGRGGSSTDQPEGDRDTCVGKFVSSIPTPGHTKLPQRSVCATLKFHKVIYKNILLKKVAYIDKKWNGIFMLF